MPNQYAATFKQAEIILQPSFSYRKHKFAKIKLYFMENFSATLMRAGQAFQVTFSSCRGISPPIHQEFKRPDKPKMLSGPSRTHHREPAAS